MNSSMRKSISVNPLEASQNLGHPQQNIRDSLYTSSIMDGDRNTIDSEGFAVYSNVKFLYLIGKISSETG